MIYNIDNANSQINIIAIASFIFCLFILSKFFRIKQYIAHIAENCDCDDK